MTGEKGWCLNPVELLILFGLAGITESLCMELPEQRDVKREKMIKGLFHLAQSGLVEITEQQQIRLEPSAAELLKTVRNAEKIWVASTRKQGVIKLQYLSGGQITMVERSEETGLFHLSGMKTDEWRLNITDLQNGKELDNIQDGKLLEKYVPEIQAEREELEKNFSFDRKNQRIFEVWELIQKEKRACKVRIIFLEGILFSWMVVQQEETMEVFYNSGEERNALERKLRKIE